MNTSITILAVALILVGSIVVLTLFDQHYTEHYNKLQLELNQVKAEARVRENVLTGELWVLKNE